MNKHCFLKEQEQTNKSIFDYVVDSSKYINHNECNNYTPPFLTYIPSGSPVKNVDIENDLKGITRLNTKCVSCKYQPEQPLTQANPFRQQVFNAMPNNKNECKPTYNILPKSYLSK